MNKTELIEAISDKSGLTKKDAKLALDATLESITEALASKKDVLIIGFGTFSSVERIARKGTIPGSGKVIDIPARFAPRFKAGKLLKDSVK